MLTRNVCKAPGSYNKTQIYFLTTHIHYIKYAELYPIQNNISTPRPTTTRYRHCDNKSHVLLCVK